MRWVVADDYAALSRRAADLLLEAVAADARAVLGLPTGSTPVGMYRAVVAGCAARYHCFRDVTTFNLDEYAGLPADDPHSYAAYMRDHLFAHVDIDPANANIPDGAAEDLEAECARYEARLAAAGGLGLTFLGLGRNGHIGFNEPGASFASRTHVVTLAPSTRLANAAWFADRPVPERAITMGIGTILESRSIVLLASGAGKREAVARLRRGDVDASFPASALRKHPDVTVLVDRDAAA